MAESAAEILFGSEYIDQGSGCGLLRLSGEMDLASVPDLERALLEADGQSTLILDLRRLHFIDCASLSAIFSEADSYRLAGRWLVIVPGQNSVERVLRIVRASERVVISSWEMLGQEVESLPTPFATETA